MRVLKDRSAFFFFFNTEILTVPVWVAIVESVCESCERLIGLCRESLPVFGLDMPVAVVFKPVTLFAESLCFKTSVINSV